MITLAGTQQAWGLAGRVAFLHSISFPVTRSLLQRASATNSLAWRPIKQLHQQGRQAEQHEALLYTYPTQLTGTAFILEHTYRGPQSLLITVQTPGILSIRQIAQ